MKKIFSIALLSTISYGTTLTTKEIKLNGLTQISEKLAFERINSNKEDLNQVIKNFYKMGYFTNIEIIEEDKTININFTEKPFIVNIEMEGHKTREEDLKELYKTMKIKKGSMFTEKNFLKLKIFYLMN